MYADFDYPEEIEGLIRYMPAPPGAASGPGAIEQRWHEFLDRKAKEYKTGGPQRGPSA